MSEAHAPNGNPPEPAGETTPQFEGEPAGTPGADDDVQPRAQARIEALAKENKALRDARTEDRERLARLEGRMEERDRRPTAPPAAPPEFDDEAEELRYHLKKQAKDIQDLRAQVQNDSASRAQRNTLKDAKEGLSFGDLSRADIGELVDPAIKAAIARKGSTATSVRKVAQRLAKRFNPNDTSRTQPTPPKGQQYVDDKKAAGAQTRTPSAASSKPAQGGEKPKTLAEKRAGAQSRLAAFLGAGGKAGRRLTR